jgi:hypothetical protein
MSTERGRGEGDGVHPEHTDTTSPTPPSIPSLPDFLTRERERCLRTVREATVQEITCITSYLARKTVIAVQSGWVPHRDQEWIQVQTAASFLDYPPTEASENARADRIRIIAEITKTFTRLSAPPHSTLDEIRKGLPWEPEDTDEEIDAQGQDIFDTWEPPPPDPALVRLHALNCAQYPWITYRLGYRPIPVEGQEPAEDPKPERHALTLTSCRKARERAKEREIYILPRWAACLNLMYQEIVAEIGLWPEQRDVNGERVYSIDRIVNAKGYRPGNLRWADKSQQRDNQERNGQTRVSG